MAEESPPESGASPRINIFSSILVIAGFITLLVIVIWGLFNIATLASPWVSAFFDNKEDAPEEIVSSSTTITTPVEPEIPVTPIAAPASTTTALISPVATTSPDLSVRIVSLNVDPSGMGIAEFDISNEGGNESGVYYFTARLPVESDYLYTSPAQKSLPPGGRILNALRFSPVIGGAVSIAVDPSNGVHESDESNNKASQSIPAPFPY